MNSDVALGISMLIVFKIAFILFGAPFLPFLRHWAIGLVVLLTILGNIFVILVIIVTICIGFGHRPPPKVHVLVSSSHSDDDDKEEGGEKNDKTRAKSAEPEKFDKPSSSKKRTRRATKN